MNQVPSRLSTSSFRPCINLSSSSLLICSSSQRSLTQLVMPVLTAPNHYQTLGISQAQWRTSTADDLKEDIQEIGAQVHSTKTNTIPPPKRRSKLFKKHMTLALTAKRGESRSESLFPLLLTAGRLLNVLLFNWITDLPPTHFQATASPLVQQGILQHFHSFSF